MSQKNQKPPKKLEARLEYIENLHRRYKITDRMMDVLDAVARVEARVLSFEEIVEEFTRSL